MTTRAYGIVFFAALVVAAFIAACGSGNSSTSCTTDTECGSAETCQSGVCKPRSASKLCQKAADCAAGSDCVGGVCKTKYGSCFADTDCTQGMRCNITKNVCVFSTLSDGGTGGDTGLPDTGAAELVITQCSSDFQCSSPTPSCVEGFCKSCKDFGCPSQAQCDLGSGLCVAKPTDGGSSYDGPPYDAGGGTDAGTRDAGAHDAGTRDAGGGQDTGTEDTGGGNPCDTANCPCGTWCDQGSGACISGCANLGDCCAGASCVNNQCVVAQCAADTDCTTAPNTHCEKTGGTCVECTQDYHCSGSTCDKTTWTCAPKSAGDVGAACAADAECQMGGFCITEKDTSGNDTGFIGGYCSQDCTSSKYCDSYSASCIQVSSSPAKSECLLDCVTDSECRAEYICVSVGSSGECYPRCDNPGFSCATGYVCQTGSGQCEGTQDVQDPCGGTYAECKPGLVCAGYTGQQYHCYKECDPSASSGPFCSTGEVCQSVGSTGICDYGGTVASGGTSAREAPRTNATRVATTMTAAPAAAQARRAPSSPARRASGSASRRGAQTPC